MSRKWNYVEIPIRCFKSKNVSFLITWESRLFLSIRKHSDWRLSKNHISEWVSLSFLFWPALFSWNYLTCPQTFSQSSFKRWSWHCLKSQDKLEDKWWEYDDIWVVHGGKISILGEYLLACLFWQQTWFVNRDSNLLWAGFFISVIGCVLPLFVSILCCWMGVTYWRYQNQGDSHPPRLLWVYIENRSGMIKWAKNYRNAALYRFGVTFWIENLISNPRRHQREG